MSKIFKQIPIKDNIDRLPLGIETTNAGNLYDVVYRKLSKEEIKTLKDKKYISRHPIEWLAKVVCTVVESIGGVPVYAPYAAGGFKVFPEIIHEIPSLDVFFLFIGGHIHNFGYVIKGISGTCGHCDKTQSFDTNIETLKIDVDFERSYHHFSVNLQDGFVIENPETRQMVKYVKIDFRMAVLGDALQFKNDYRPNNQGSFTEKIYANCIEAVYDDNGGQMDPTRITLIMAGLLKDVSALDGDLIEEAFNDNIPKIANNVIEICRNCSDDMDIFINHGFLFTQRRLD